MKIAGVGVEMLEIPFREPIASAGGRWDRRRVGLLRVRADDGSQGLGELAAPAPAGFRAVAVQPADLEDLLLGVDAADPSAVAAALDDIDARVTLGRVVRSGVESAVVDLLAQAKDVPVGRWLAEAPAREVWVNGLVGISPPDEAAARARRLAAAGFGCLKLKCGPEAVATLIDRVAAVRGSVGREVAIRLDFNGALEPADAAEALAALGRFDLDYVEQPIAAEAGVTELAGLRARSGVAIAADEAVYDLRSADELIAAGAVDALVVKPARVGGLRRARRIVERASAAGVRVTVSTLFETGVGMAGALHLAATVPGGHAHGLATADLLASDLLDRPLALVGGRMAVPAGPGLGITLDPLAVERFRVA